MRPIDADAQRDKLQNLADDEWNQNTTTSWAEAFAECADMVEDAPTIEPEPHSGRRVYQAGYADGFEAGRKAGAQEWIPCKVRLPKEEDYRECMECLDGAVWYYTDRKTMGLGYYYDSTKQWSTICDMKPDGNVIAWMLLPECYQEDI